MQEENFGSILTNIGKAKVANATLLNSNIALKTLKVGDSNGTYYNPTEDQAELRNTVYECALGAIKIDTNNPNWIIVETLLPGNIGGFTIREVGLFDADGDMIVVGKYPETYKPLIENGASKDINVRIIFEVSNTESVTLNINPSVIIATKEDINNLQEQIENNDSQLKEIEKNKVDKTALNDCVILKRTGVLLNGNANLNSSILYAIGTYYYPDNGHTIYNSPTTDRFKMTVEEIGIPQVLLQKIITGNTGAGVKIYTRYANLSTNTFSEWQQLATVDDTGWIDLPLLNGATTTSDKAIYRRIGKMVYFKGVVNNITTDNFIFGNLPIGFRPNSKSGGSNIPVPLFLPGEDIPSRLTVYQNGNLQLSRKNDKNTCYLDGVIFVLD